MKARIEKIMMDRSNKLEHAMALLAKIDAKLDKEQIPVLAAINHEIKKFLENN
jgi:hypothetical protein